jgi:predicted DNA-binding transcriptional regulator AlpA
MTDIELMTLGEVEKYLEISAPTIWRKIVFKELPEPVFTHGSKAYWNAEQIRTAKGQLVNSRTGEVLGKERE